MNNLEISYRLIEMASDLEQAAKLLSEEEIIAVDLEADSLYHYREKVCLIQIATKTFSLAIDPLAIGDLSSLQPVMANPAIRKVFHGSDYDIRSLYRDFQITVDNIFDTQLACRFLGLKETGLEALLRIRFQVSLDKKFQKRDWSVRPLSPEMLAYGILDVTYLIPLARALEKELSARNRLAWVEEEGKILSRIRPGSPVDRGPLFLRFKGASGLDPRSLSMLEALLQFRNAQAEKMDRPPFKVLGNEPLLELIRKKPLNMPELRESKILTARQIAIFGEPLLDRLREAADPPASGFPGYPQRARPKMAAPVRRRFKALKAWKDERGNHLGMDPTLLLNNALTQWLAEKKPLTRLDLEAVPGLKTWQKEEFGEEILAVLAQPGERMAPLLLTTNEKKEYK